ncbi:MAG: dephospho-CoA kinase, partial [Gammaproteobacteria bacterium]|nr:dephospho-CoA kinase [Gammaproteobacteria bacterium]
MLTIGLTGGVGSGKTTVTRHFSALGVPVIDADELARDLVKPGEYAYEAILKEFGPSILTAEREIDRRKLRNLIFHSPQNRVVLESILHPLIRQQIQHQIESISAPYCIVAIPLLIETGQTDIVDRILVISAPRQEQIRRTVVRDGVAAEDVEAILAAQVGNELRTSMADDVLENDGDLDSIYPKVKALHEKYLGLAGVEILAETPEIVEHKMNIDSSLEESQSQEQNSRSEIPLSDTQTTDQSQATAGGQNVYELPLNEKMRTLIRLEFLFSEIEHYLQGATVWDIRSAVNTFLATLNVLLPPEAPIPWDEISSFQSFLDYLERIKTSVNVVPLVGQGMIRAA